jgi:beta-galactosidase
MYMVHGGTNFGLTAGANPTIDYDGYTAHITSYDYDAPINEQGAPTEKFTVFRNLAQQYVSWEIPMPPNPLPAIEIPSFRPYRIASMFGNLGAPLTFSTIAPPHFEHPDLQMFNQGMVVYQA